MIDVRVSNSDLRGVMAAMERGRKELGMSLGAVVRMGLRSVASTLGTETAVAPAKRKAGSRTALEQRLTKSGKVSKRPGKTTTYGLEWERGPVKGFIAVAGAKNRAEAKASPKAVIKRRGYAKASWHHAAAKAGVRTGVKRGVASSQTQGKVWRRVSGEGVYSGREPRAMIENRVKYMDAALKGGANAVESAMQRAGRFMGHEIDRRIKEKLEAR
jgi:hypothetical protein